jgi:hypothetical protein
MGVNDSLEVFLDILMRKYPELKSSRSYFWETFDSSGLVSIEIHSLRYGVALSLPNGIIFSPKVMNTSLPSLLFTLFHEVAHQYQFKKYGTKKMMAIHTGEFSVSEGLSFLRQMEVTADRYAEQKLLQMKKLGLLSPNEIIPKGFYKSLGDEHYFKIYEMTKNLLSEENTKDPEIISQILYEKLKT